MHSTAPIDGLDIYLDIDGVLLAHPKQPAYYADEFIQAVLTKYPSTTYWLTTHVWNGEHVANESLAPYLKAETQALLAKIKPTEWGDAKTDGIDFSKPFLWFDDDLFEDEHTALAEHHALDSRVMVNLYENPEQLKDLIQEYFS